MSLASLFGFTGNARIEPRAAWKKVEDGAVLLDVRSPEEFATGAAPGAINIPVQSLGQRMTELEKSKEIVVYCRSGGRSATAARMLQANGFDVVDAGGLSSLMSGR